MIDYIIKSAISLGILLAVYHLFLEKEKMHRFNRFYLITALAFSLTLPFITIPVYVEAAQFNEAIGVNLSDTGIAASSQPLQSEINYWPYLAWGLYGMVTLLLAIRFAVNISRFYSLRKRSCTVEWHEATLVLLEEDVLPHTFGKNIYLSKKDYEQSRIEPELLSHEMVHVRQKHTLDILVAETLKTLLWFNPLLYLYKKAVQLNHEFLADEAIINQSQNIFSYQQLLLEKASLVKARVLASSINFGITKKRFIMMTKTTSRAKSLLLQTATLPLAPGLLLLLCSEAVAQKSTNEKTAEKPSKTTPSNKSRLEKLELSQAQVDSVKAADPEKFSEDPNKRFKDTKFRYTDKNDKVTEVTGYNKLNEEQKKVVADTPVYSADYLEIQETGETTDPEFPGGIDALKKAVMDEFKIPELNKGGKFRILLWFVIKTDGSMANIKAEIDPGYGLGDEAVRALGTITTKWKPAMKNGKPVRAAYSLPLVIEINNA